MSNIPLFQLMTFDTIRFLIFSTMNKMTLKVIVKQELRSLSYIIQFSANLDNIGLLCALHHELTRSLCLNRIIQYFREETSVQKDTAFCIIG